MTRVYGSRWPWLFALYLAVAIVCGYQSWSRVVIEPDGRAWTNQDSVDILVSSLSDHPIETARWASVRSRVLVPLLIVGAHDYLGIPYRLTHDGTRLLFIFASLLLMHWYLRAWFTPLESLAGTLIVIATITTTFNSAIPQVTEFPELIGMTVCAGLLVRGRWSWMMLALAIATLNRETTIILAPVVLCVVYDWRTPWLRQFAVAASVVVVGATWWLAHALARNIVGVHGEWFVPPEGTGHGQGLAAEFLGTFLDTWPRRVESMMSLVHNPHPYNANWSMFLLLNVFWILPLVYWRSIPSLFRRLYVGGLLGGLPIFAFVGVLNESGRHMIPLYPLVMPAGLLAFSRFIVPPAAPVLAPAADEGDPASVHL